jgi:hypothetical protein
MWWHELFEHRRDRWVVKDHSRAARRRNRLFEGKGSDWSLDL